MSATMVSLGCTIHSTTQLVFRLIADLKPFYGALPCSDQLILDKFFEAVLKHRGPMGNADYLLPMQVLPFVILLEERKKWDRVHSEPQAVVEELNTQVNQLSQPA